MHRIEALVFALAMTAGCSKHQAAPPSGTAAAPVPAHASAPAAQSAGRSVTGPVLETMNAASYTYVRIKGDSGDIWAAAPEFPVKVGDRVRVSLDMPMVNFHSASLNRDFPVLYFVNAITPADAPDTASAAPPAAMHGAPSASPAMVTTPMPAPPGGITIARLWADRKPLAGKQVTVHGVVVKFNGGILGVNWIHLQDGTGKTGDGSNDVTVTTAQDVPVKPGDTIVATGTVGIDKDVGAGYVYPVIVENARITPVKTTGS